MSSGGGGTTTVQNSGPPTQFLNAYQNVNDQAQRVAQTAYQPYQGNIVASLSPDQNAAISGIENLQGIASPYINSAAQYINNSTTPLWSSTQQFSPEAVQKYENPYTKDVVKATEEQFNNQNAQQQQQVIGNAISAGAWGGDRSAVAQSILAGQQETAEAPVIAGLESKGYEQALQEFNQQQGAQLGANQANAWLNSQAGFGMANLGNEALRTGLAGTSALMGAGDLEQKQAQSILNVPYQQYIAEQAYPFQTTGWLANIAEGLGGAAGGTSSTTTPGPSVGSQIAGAGLAGAGILGQTGAFGSGGWLTGAGGLFGSGAASGATDLAAATGANDFINTAFDVASFAARGGGIPHRAPGGNIPDESISIIPGAFGMGTRPAHPGSGGLLNTSTGSTTTTSGGGGSALGSILPIVADAAMIALAAKDGGRVPHEGRGIIVPFPPRGRGITAANDDLPYEPRRAAGGILPISVSTSPGRYAGSPDIPNLAFGPLSYDMTGAGITGNALDAATASSVPHIQDYLRTALGGASFAPPPSVPSPPPPDKTPAADQPAANTLQSPIAGGLGGGEGGQGGVSSDAAAAAAGGLGMAGSQGVGMTDLGAQAAGTAAGLGADFGGGGASGTGGSGDINGGMGGLYRTGGRVQHRADSGAVEDTGPDGSDQWDLPATDQWDVPATAGRPSPGITGSMIGGPPEAPPDSLPDHRFGTGSPWETLTAAGLGIMSGRSPYAAVNIGQGGLEGVKFGEQQRLREAQLEGNQLYRMGLLGVRNRQASTGERRADIGQQRADTADRAVDVRQSIADRAAALRAQGMETNQANAQARLELAKEGLSIREAATQNTADYRGSRLGQMDRQLDLRSQAIANSKEAQDARLRLQQAGQDATSANADIGAASRMVASGAVKDFNTALTQVHNSRGAKPPSQAQTPVQQAAPPSQGQAPVPQRGPPPPAAIDFLKQHPELKADFQRKYGVDPTQYLGQ